MAGLVSGSRLGCGEGLPLGAWCPAPEINADSICQGVMLWLSQDGSTIRGRDDVRAAFPGVPEPGRWVWNPQRPRSRTGGSGRLHAWGHPGRAADPAHGLGPSRPCPPAGRREERAFPCPGPLSPGAVCQSFRPKINLTIHQRAYRRRSTGRPGCSPPGWGRAPGH